MENVVLDKTAGLNLASYPQHHYRYLDQGPAVASNEPVSGPVSRFCHHLGQDGWGWSVRASAIDSYENGLLCTHLTSLKVALLENLLDTLVLVLGTEFVAQCALGSCIICTLSSLPTLVSADRYPALAGCSSSLMRKVDLETAHKVNQRNA